MPDLAVSAIDEDELPFVWPLVRAGGYDLELPGWLINGRSLIARGGSILAAQAPDSTFFGVATCEAVEQARARVLAVATFVTFELSGDAPVRRALTDAVEALGRKLGCAAVAVPGPDAPFLKELRKRRQPRPNARTDARAAAAPPSR
jgi:hypothetical protein